MSKTSKLGKINFSSLSLPESQLMSQLIDNVNTLGGHSGEVELSNHLNLSGNKITNVGAAEGSSDVLTNGKAETKYSAKALRPQLEAGGTSSLRTYMSGLKGDVTASGPGIAQSTVGNVTGITFTQISGKLTVGQLPTVGVSGTVSLAPLTVGGTNGSLTITNGLVTNIVDPT